MLDERPVDILDNDEGFRKCQEIDAHIREARRLLTELTTD
jgi:hypothetical protein